MPRPPLKAAQEAAAARLLDKYHGEYIDLVDEELAKRGWSQQVVERKVWTQASASGVGPPSSGS